MIYVHTCTHIYTYDGNCHCNDVCIYVYTHMYIYFLMMVAPTPPCKYNDICVYVYTHYMYMLMMVTPTPSCKGLQACVPTEWPKKLNYWIWISECRTCGVVSGSTDQPLSQSIRRSQPSCPSALCTQHTALPGQNLWQTSGNFFHLLSSRQNPPNTFLSLLYLRCFPSGIVVWSLFLLFIYLIYDTVLPCFLVGLQTSGEPGLWTCTIIPGPFCSFCWKT